MSRYLWLLLLLLPISAHAQSSPPPSATYCINGNSSWVPCSFPYPISVSHGTSIGGSLTTGGTWQQIAAAEPGRVRFYIQNYCSAATEGIPTAESMFIALSPTQPSGTPQANNAMEVIPCASYDTSITIVGNTAIWVYAATTGHTWNGNEFP